MLCEIITSDHHQNNNNTSGFGTWGHLARRECLVDTVNFSIQSIAALAITLAIVWHTCLGHGQKRHKSAGEYLVVRYHEHSCRWILCLCLVAVHLLECGEGLMAVHYNDLTFPMMHPVASPCTSVLGAVAAMMLYHYVEKWNWPRLLLVLFGYWPVAVAIRIAKIATLYGLGLTIYHLRLQVSWASMFLNCLLMGLEITVVVVQRYLCDVPFEDAPYLKADVTDIRYLHPFSSLFSRATFSWLIPLLKQGYRKPLELGDLGVLPEEEMAEYQYIRFNKAFTREKALAERKGRDISLWKCMWNTFWKTLFVGGIIKVMGDIVGLIGPLSISIILAYVSAIKDGTLPHGTLEQLYYPTTWDFLQNGFVMCGIVLFATFLQSTFSNNFNHLAIAEGIHLRTAVQCLVYKKSLKMSCASGLDTGALVNHMSVDAFNLMMLFSMGHYIWAVPVKIILLLFLLHMHLGYSALIGAATIYILAPIQYYICTLLSRIQKKALEISDERLKRTTELLQGIKLLKLYGWESMYANLIQNIRTTELKVLRSDAICVAINTFVTQGSSIVVTLVAFGIYSRIEGKPLTPSDVFTGLALFNQLTVPLYIIPMVIPMVINAVVSIKRLTEFLNLPEVDMSLPWRDNSDAPPVKVEYYPETGSVLLQVRDNPTDSRCFGSEESDGVFFPDIYNYSPPPEDSTLVTIKNGYFTYDLGPSIPSLCDINLQIPTGKLTVIVGPIGSGKSSLLSAILGELHTLNGAVTWNSSPQVAYVPQKPWLMNATLKDNILFGEFFDSRRYHQVIQACALQPDIDLLPARDFTEIGERGLNLSGGQKQRIALARAFYSPARLVVLDDPLSALDAHVGAYVFEHGVKTLLLRRNRTVILVTHKMEFLSAASKVILMESGSIKAQGTAKEVENAFKVVNFNARRPGRDIGAKTPADGTSRERHKLVRLLSKQSLYRTASTQEIRRHSRLVSLSRQMSHDPSSPLPCHDWGDHDDPLPQSSDPDDPSTGHKLVKKVRSIESLRSRSTSSSSSVIRKSAKFTPSRLNSRISNRTGEDDVIEEEEEEEMLEKSICDAEHPQSSSTSLPDGKLIKEEDREKGNISKKVYLTYLKACGLPLSFLVIFLIIGSQAMKIGTDFWLSKWSDSSVDDRERDIHYYIYIYAALSIGSIILAFFTNLASQLTSLNAVKILHNRMLMNIVQSPMRFFDSTPVGRIINRFSADMSTIDKKLPVTLPVLLRFVLLCISAILVDIIVSPYFIIAVVPLGAIYYFLQHFFRFTSRELQRLDCITKSPIFSHFSETVNGLSTIRAFRAEKRFTETVMTCINVNNTAFILVNCANCWLGVSLDYLGGVILFIATVSSMLTFIYGDISSSMVGMAITYTLLVPIYLNWVVRNLASAEMYMSAVERVHHYSKLTRETVVSSKMSSAAALKDWPSQGEIIFKNIVLKYDPNGDPVLKNISLTIKAGEKVGICGRTGSGKSSLVLALFRMVDICNGHIEIDGVDIGSIPLQLLRSKLSIIPQESILFSGTIRENLDPGDEYSDDELWNVLEAAQLRPIVMAQPGGLEAKVSEDTSNFSAGQHQLFCLARALLRKSKILIMDEATSSLDPETDRILQDAVTRHYADCTVLSIAHRVQSLLNFDKVVVLEMGRVVETGCPKELLSMKGSIFASLVKASHQQH